MAVVQTNSIFDLLEADFDSNIESYSSNMDEHYSSFPELDIQLVETYNETCDWLGLANGLDQNLASDRDKTLHVIMSIVGDDEHSTTDSVSIGPALIGFGPIINGVILSKKDSGVSHYVGNYAEGWILSPPSAEATFEATNRRHARSGVAFTLDPVKLKLLSPVRKQSGASDLDLESKLEQLAEIASWTDRSWFTYDYHQMCLILANAIFDFEDAVTFPYLFKTEGGCGGAPPYGNIDTLYSALHYYTRGKSRRGILGVMEEAVAVNSGQLAPKNTFFLRNSHLANMGDMVWLRYEAAYRSLLAHGELSKSEANDLLLSEEEVSLPPEIRVMGTEIEPDSFVVGANLSALRKEGLIMSEMDVKSALDSQVRTRALLGDEPIGELSKRLEIERAAFRGKHLKILSEISNIDPTIRGGLSARGLLMPDNPDQVFRDLAIAYYSMRTEEYSRYTSLFYTDVIRVFRTDEIRSMIDAPSTAVRADFARADSFPNWKMKFLEENSEERHRRRDVHTWFGERPLSELLYHPLPPGVGTDDARIARNILALAESCKAEQDISAMAVILFSGDRQLARLTTALVRRQLDKTFRVLSIDRSLYTRICLAGVQERNASFRRSRRTGNDLWTGIRRPGEYIMYYNYMLKTLWPLPDSIITQCLNMCNLAIGSRALLHVEYDYPNMERGLDCIRVQPSTGTVEEYGGGYLERRTLNAFSSSDCWARQELGEIYSWSDFDQSRSKRHYPLRPTESIRDQNIYGFDPESVRSYSRIQTWRRNAIERSMSQKSGSSGGSFPIRS